MSERYETRTLTRSQQLIWTGQRLQPDEPLYNMALAFRIAADLDIECFRRAFAHLIEQSDALRTTIATRDGVPRQRIHEHLAYRVEAVDLSAKPDPEAALASWLAERAKRPFDLSRCLFDSTLVRVGAADTVWFLNQHHLTTDAWSTSVIYRHMSELYVLARADRLAEAPPLPAYADYIDYEQKKQASRMAQSAREYWEPRLHKGLQPSSFYRPTPPDRRGRTERRACPLGARRSAALNALAAREGFTAFTPDLARFQLFATVLFTWLYRLSGNRRLALGTPSHNRSAASHKRTVGLFIEIYPLQVQIDDGETFGSLYDKVATASRELLVNAPSGGSTFEHQRAYDVVLNYITARYGDFAGHAMQSRWVHADHGDRNHLVRVQVEDFDRTAQFGVHLDLNVDTFVGNERQRASEHFLAIVDALLADPDARLDDVALTTPGERAALLDHRAIAPAPQPATVCAMIDEQIARTPGAPALVCGEHTMSYAGLGAAVAAMQARLGEAGVGPGARVAIALPRGIEAVVAMLAAMRAGAAYVPVDPAYPAGRIAFMLEDAQVTAVVVDASTRGAIPDGHVCVDAGAPVAGSASPHDASQADGSAYMIYTSGSTGRPKGVEIGHASLLHYLCWARDQYAGDAALAWPLFSSLSFDLTVTSTYVPLIGGGKLVIYPESDEPGDLAIRRVIEDNAVDIIKLTPAHLALVATMDLSASRLRALILGGEDLKCDLARTVSKFFDDRIAIFNEYGPTEGTVACMIHRFDPQADTGTSVPIGHPVAHTEIYLLDANRQLQPPGVIGEIAIGGQGLAKGYWRRPELTAERFVDNPFRPGQRMYLTGDLARWRPDGDLAYLGRIDHQVKVNGVRVEPGEVEAALSRIAGVEDAVVQLVERHEASDQAWCRQCGLDGLHPNARLDDSGLCHICRVYEDERERALNYFGTLDDLRRIIADVKATATGEQDSIVLLSGGKDSTYALCQLVDMGLHPLVFTLDNGFISDGAKANIQRIVDQLGLELVVGTTPAMNAIFADSLKRFSNVCNGCFKTIYTLSVNLARERGLHTIFTGLSRGQIFETRVADQFHQRIFDPAEIDRNIIAARKAYHRADDAVSRHLDVSAFADDAVFEEIRFVDFYRYTSVSLDEMFKYLGTRVPWVRPADTGRSTNCLINEAGIYVHKKERGYHNYALPYSWDVRLGHKERDAARHELDDHIDVDNVRRILEQVGYPMPAGEQIKARHRFLTAYYVAAEDLDVRAVQAALAATLPPEFVPARFMRLDALPLTHNGKVDRDALPDPDTARPDLDVRFVAPEGVVERELAAIWCQVLGVDRVGANDNFFDLGGDSILNIQIVARARQRGLSLSPQQIFEHPTVAALARVAGDAREVRSEQGAITGPVPLTPIQMHFFERRLPDPAHYNQYVVLEATAALDPLVFDEALRHVVAHHDALRARFERVGDAWQQSLADVGDAVIVVEQIDLSALPDEERDAALAAHATRLHDSFDLGAPPLLRVARVERGAAAAPALLLVAHHLVIDGVSWWILLEDLQSACAQLAAGHPVALPPKTSSVRRWAQALRDYARRDDSWRFWVDHAREATSMAGVPGHPGTPANDLASAAEVRVALDRRQTAALLVDAASRWRAQAPDLLLAALVDVLCAWNGTQHVQIDVEGHGRENVAEDLDLLRTVGWFTALYPVTLARPGADATAAQRVRAVKDVLRTLPARGVSFGAHRYLSPDPAVRDALAALPASPVLFNYLGQWDRARAGGHVFQFARPLGASFGHGGARTHVLEVNAIAYDGRLQVDWTYSRDLHDEATVRALADAFRDAVLGLIAQSREDDGAALSPTDFPTAGLSQGDLDELLADFGES